VGADRLVNALAGYDKYRSALIIVDFGTATTFDVITARGEYAGGSISPGITLANRSLSDFTAKLPRVDIKKTPRVICYRTESSMQSGVFHGYVGLVNHMVRQIKKEMRARPKVIATGGLAPLIANSTEVIESVYPNLTLDGLRLVWKQNLS
jgi:type III pantothenate kinase